MEAKIYDFYSFLYAKWASQYVDVFEDNELSLEEANAWAKENIPACNFAEMRPYITEELNNRGYSITIHE